MAHLDTKIRLDKKGRRRGIRIKINDMDLDTTFQTGCLRKQDAQEHLSIINNRIAKAKTAQIREWNDWTNSQKRNFIVTGSPDGATGGKR